MEAPVTRPADPYPTSYPKSPFNKKQVEPYFDTRQLRAAFAKGLLKRPLSDVFVFADHPATVRLQCSIASLTGGAISHESAAMLHRLDGFDECPGLEIHVCYQRDHKRRLPGYRVHTWRRTSRQDITWVDGIRCTSIARTLAQLGLRQPRDVVEPALDSARRRGVSDRWIQMTLDRLRRPGPTGQEVLGQIIADPSRSGVLAESMLEVMVERMLREHHLPPPVRQFEVQVESGLRRFDLAFPDARLGIEGHSRKIHFGPAKDETDNVRDIELAAAGWEVIYITWNMAHEPDLFIRLLKKTYYQRLQLFQGNADLG